MANKKLSYDQLAEKKLLQPLIDELKRVDKKLLETEKKLKATLKTVQSSMSGGGDAKTLKKIQALEVEIRKLKDTTKGLNDVQKAREQVQKENIRLKERQKVLNTDLAKSNAELKIKIQEQNKVVKQAARERLGLVSLYEKEAKRLVELRKRYKDVALAEGETSKKAIELRNAAQKLDARLKRLDSNVGQFQRNVGNYRRAWASVGRILTSAGILGGAAGVIAAFKDISKTIIGFEKSLSSLSSITGAVGDDLAFYKNEAIAVGAATTKTSSQVLDAFREIGSARPELLKNKEALAAVTKEAIILSEAAGLDVPQAAKALAAGLNQFQLPAEDSARIINTLAAGSKLGSVAIPEITEGLNKFGGIARVANIPIEASVALIEAIGPAGLVGAEGGTKIRNVLISLAKGADDTNPKIVGLETALENLAKQELTTAELAKLFGKQNLLAAQTLIEQRKKVKDLTKELTGTNIAYEQAAINTDNLDGNIKRLDSAWEGLILTIDSGEGGISGFISVIVLGVTKLLNLLSGVEKSFQDVNQEIFNNAEASGKAAVQSQILLDEYESLVADGLEPSADETERLEEITLLLGDALGESVVAIDKETGALLLNTDAVREQIKIKRFAADQEATALAARLLGEQNAIKSAEIAQKLANNELEIRKRIAKDSGVFAEQERARGQSGFAALPKFTEEQAEAFRNLNKARAASLGISNDLAQRRENEIDLLEKLKALNFDLRDVELLFTEDAKEKEKTEDGKNKKDKKKSKEKKSIREDEAAGISHLIEREIEKEQELQKELDKVAEADKKRAEELDEFERMIEENRRKRREAAAKKEEEDRKKRLRERQKTVLEIAKSVNQLADKLFDKRIKQIDKEVSAEEKRISRLRELADQGNEDAQNNIALAEKRQAELELKREQQLKRQKQSELALAAVQAYSSKVASGQPNALAATVTDISVLTAFIKSLPAFYGGSEMVGDDIPATLPGKDGTIIRVDKKERIMTGTHNAMIPKGMSNLELAMLAQNSAISGGSERTENKVLEGMIGELIQVTKNRPVYLGSDYNKITDIVTTSVKKRGLLEKTHKKNGSIWGN